MATSLRKVVIETLIPTKFKYVARDLDGSVHAFEKEPNLDYGTNANPYPCDMWDVLDGATMPISYKTAVSAGFLTDEIGDWRDSCKKLTDVVSIEGVTK